MGETSREKKPKRARIEARSTVEEAEAFVHWQTAST